MDFVQDVTANLASCFNNNIRQHITLHDMTAIDFLNKILKGNPNSQVQHICLRWVENLPFNLDVEFIFIIYTCCFFTSIFPWSPALLINKYIDWLFSKKDVFLTEVPISHMCYVFKHEVWITCDVSLNYITLLRIHFQYKDL